MESLVANQLGLNHWVVIKSEMRILMFACRVDT